MKSIKVNTNTIRNLGPCWDRLFNYLQHYNDFEGTLIDFLDLDKITAKDKVWVCVRLLSPDVLTLLAFDVFLQTIRVADVAAVDVTEAVSNTAVAASDVAAAASAASHAAALDDLYGAAASVTDARFAAYYTIAYAADVAYAAANDSSADVAYHVVWDNAVESIKYLVSEEGL